MSRKVQRQDLLDFHTYSDRRDQLREEIFVIKAPRRIHVGPVLTFLFENVDTMRYQIQEMMRLESMARESDILHELNTYNAVLGDAGEVACTLLIELDDEAERAKKLRHWLSVPSALYLRCGDGSLVRPTFDSAQVGEERVSAVQYLKFEVGERLPVAVGCDFDDPMLRHEHELTTEQAAALAADLRD